MYPFSLLNPQPQVWEDSFRGKSKKIQETFKKFKSLTILKDAYGGERFKSFLFSATKISNLVG